MVGGGRFWKGFEYCFFGFLIGVCGYVWVRV